MSRADEAASLIATVKDGRAEGEDFFRVFRRARTRPSAATAGGRFRLDPSQPVPPDVHADGVLGLKRHLAIDVANGVERKHRDAAFRRLVDRPGGGERVIVAEGDSWFLYPVRSVVDVMGHLEDEFPIHNRAGAGDLLKRMVEHREHVAALGTVGGRVLALSGGGNDLLGGARLRTRLAKGDGRTVASYLGPAYRKAVARIGRDYGRIVAMARAAAPDMPILVHGYAYPEPVQGGRWLGDPLRRHGVPEALWRPLVRAMIDDFHDLLEGIAREQGNVTVIDVRDAVGDRWLDELHPTNPGFADVAARFRDAFQRLL